MKLGRVRYTPGALRWHLVGEHHDRVMTIGHKSLAGFESPDALLDYIAENFRPPRFEGLDDAPPDQCHHGCARWSDCYRKPRCGEHGF